MTTFELELMGKMRRMTPRAQAQEMTAMSTVEISTVEVNGANVYYQESGQGQPLLFIHGMYGSAP